MLAIAGLLSYCVHTVSSVELRIRPPPMAVSNESNLVGRKMWPYKLK